MKKGDMGFFKNAGLVDAGKIVKTATDAHMVPQAPLTPNSYDRTGAMPGMSLPSMPKTPTMPKARQIVADTMKQVRGAVKSAVGGMRPPRMPRTPRSPGGTGYRG